jgi:hypothetical protein
MQKTFTKGLRKKLKLTIIGMPRAMIIKVVNLAREIEEKMPNHIRVDDLNHCRIVKIRMKNRLMMNRKEKEGKITRSEMMNINKECFVKNVIMKVI